MVLKLQKKELTNKKKLKKKLIAREKVAFDDDESNSRHIILKQQEKLRKEWLKKQSIIVNVTKGDTIGSCLEIVRRISLKNSSDALLCVKEDLIIPHDSHPGKVALRQWCVRKKIVFPASRWETFDPSKEYDTCAIHGGEVSKS